MHLKSVLSVAALTLFSSKVFAEEKHAAAVIRKKQRIFFIFRSLEQKKRPVAGPF